MASLTVRLPDDLHEQLRRVAFERHESIAKLIAYALYAYLDTEAAR